MKTYIDIVQKISKKLGYGGEITSDNIEEVIIAIAEHHAEELEKELDKMYTFAVKQWEFGNNGKISQEAREVFTDNYDRISGNADKILSHLGIKVDYPGLYPAFTVKVDGKEYGEYTVKNALRRFNHFWK